MTRRNAELAKESTAATTTLHELAEALAGALSAFRLSGDTAPRAQRTGGAAGQGRCGPLTTTDSVPFTLGGVPTLPPLSAPLPSDATCSIPPAKADLAQPGTPTVAHPGA